jgi:hypothetical protein
VHFVLCLIVVALPPVKSPFGAILNNNNNNIIIINSSNDNMMTRGRKYVNGKNKTVFTSNFIYLHEQCIIIGDYTHRMGINKLLKCGPVVCARMA